MDAVAAPPSIISFSPRRCEGNVVSIGNLPFIKTSFHRRLDIACKGMLAPRKILQRRRKVQIFEDAAEEADHRYWGRLMKAMEEAGSAVSVLASEKRRRITLPKRLILRVLLKFKKEKQWNVVSEILEWLRCQHWWDFSQMDFFMLIIAYGKLGDFNMAESVLNYMIKIGSPPSVISHTALMEAYGRARKYNQAEAIFQRMQLSGPEPSPLTYQIILKTFVEAKKFNEAEAIFRSLLNEQSAPFRPDQKMFHIMIYMYKKTDNYQEARKTFALMTERGISQSTITFNCLMSFESDYKEVSKIYDQMQRAKLKPDVVSYALLINAYGKARREEEALAVFEEMLDAKVRPTTKVYNILLDAFARCGMVDQARTVFKCMRRDRCTPDICSYTTMLSAYVNASDMEGAEEFFKRMHTDGFYPGVVAYGTLLKGYAKSDDMDKMMEVYETMRTQGVEVNLTVLTTIMDTHGKSSGFSDAAGWFKEMSANGLAPDRKAKNVLLSLAKTPGEKMEARRLVGGQFTDSDDDTDDELEAESSYSATEASAADDDLTEAVLGNISGFQEYADGYNEGCAAAYCEGQDGVIDEEDGEEHGFLSLEGSHCIV